MGCRVQTSMSSADIIEVVQDAVEFTGQPTAPVVYRILKEAGLIKPPETKGQVQPF